MSGQHCENYDVKRETVHRYPRNVDRCCTSFVNITRLFVFHRLDPFALLYNKSLNDWSLGEQWILFPSNLNVSLDFVSGNIEILGKQNSLFPSGPVIKCLLLAKLRRPKGPPSGAPYSYRKEKETHELIFSWLSCLAVLLAGAYARRWRRRRWSRATWRPYSKK